MQASGHGFLRDGDPSPPPAPDRVCARCGLARPPATTWPEGPVCDPCSTAALRRHGPCSGCGRQRRLVAPPGPTAITLSLIHISEPTRLLSISYAVFCLKKKKKT